MPVPTIINYTTASKSYADLLVCTSPFPVIFRCLPRIIFGPFFPSCPPFCCSGFHGIPAEMTSTFCCVSGSFTWYKARHHTLGLSEFGHSSLDLGGQCR